MTSLRWWCLIIIIIIIIINEVLFYSDSVMNNITEALYTINGKNNETKRCAADQGVQNIVSQIAN